MRATKKITQRRKGTTDRRKLKLSNLTIVFLFFLLYATSCSLWEKPDETPYVVVLSMDAFRWDYPDKIPTPNLDYVAKHGVKAKSLVPCFPSKTFPNHYSMATGLYPDNHGIVMNSFYDPDLKKYYSIGDRSAVENPEFYDGEPIWVTAENQGVKSASYFWVGSETKIKNVQPTYWKKYDHNFPFEQRIDSVIAWLQKPEKDRPRLIMWYMHEPDDVGHIYGPESEETKKMIMHLDSLIGIFIKKVDALPHSNKINLIFTSDHGMCPVSSDKNIVLEEYLKKEWINEIQGFSPAYNIDAHETFEDSVYSALANVPHVKIWKHGELPVRLHYGHNKRTLDFVVVADSSWSITYTHEEIVLKGNHGFDNSNTDMHAIFYAIGPDFKNNYSHPSFSNIDLYPLISHILKLKPAKVDGSFKNVKDMLKSTK